MNETALTSTSAGTETVQPARPRRPRVELEPLEPGLASRYYFEDVLKRDFALAQRDKTDIALLLFDIDQLGPYNEVFERAGGDAVVKRVARAIAGSFRRGTDIASNRSTIRGRRRNT